MDPNEFHKLIKAAKENPVPEGYREAMEKAGIPLPAECSICGGQPLVLGVFRPSSPSNEPDAIRLAYYALCEKHTKDPNVLKVVERLIQEEHERQTLARKTAN